MASRNMPDINKTEQKKWISVYRDARFNKKIYTRQTDSKEAINRAEIYHSGEIILLTSDVIIFELAGDGSFEIRTDYLDGLAITHDGERKKPPVWWLNEKRADWL